jgi:hypothetical protein
MTPKTITISATETIAMDEAGRWTLTDTACSLHERITEEEASDVLERRARKNAALRPLIRQHFPMREFHQAGRPDHTPTHPRDW